MCFVTGGSQIAFRGNSPSNAPVLQTANLENVLIAEDPLSTLLTLLTLLPLRSPRRLLPRRRPPAPPHASEVHASEVHARRQHQTRPRHAPRQRQDVNASPPGDVRGRRVAQRGRRVRPERRTRHRDEQDRRRDERERRAGPRRYRPADAPVRVTPVVCLLALSLSFWETDELCMCVCVCVRVRVVPHYCRGNSSDHAPLRRR